MLMKQLNYRVKPSINGFLLLAALGPIYSVWAIEPPYTMENGVRVVQGKDFTDTVAIDGEAWNGALIRNNSFHDQVDFGIQLANVKGVRIENNTFRGMQRMAIKLKDDNNITGAIDVTIIGNKFESMPNTPIIVGLPNNGVKIINNEFHDVAWESSLQHAIYIKAPGYLVEGNRIDTVRGGNGISIRTAGIVRGNWITNIADVGIKYYADQPDKGDGRLLIETNFVLNSGDGGIGFSTSDGTVIDLAVVRFNTLVNNYRSLRFENGLTSLQFTIYGNVFVESGGKWIYGASEAPKLTMTDNIQSADPSALFIDFPNMNLRLKAGSPAIKSVKEMPTDPFGLPQKDFYGFLYGDSPYDAGASSSRLPSPTGLSITEGG